MHRHFKWLVTSKGGSPRKAPQGRLFKEGIIDLFALINTTLIIQAAVKTCL